MLCRLIRFNRKLQRFLRRAVIAVAERLTRRVRVLWHAHLEKVATNAAYAAATAAVLGGVLGVIPVRDVLAAVMAAAFGVYIKGTQHAAAMSGRWEDPWDKFA